MRDEFIIQRQGKQFVLFAGLLGEAHSRGLVGIGTELLQVPDEANGQRAIVKAVVTIEDADSSTGEVRQSTFSGIGDASPDNVSRNIVPHLIRMGETRAKARALRDAINVSAMALEEESGTDDTNDNRSSSANASSERSQDGKSGSRGGSSSNVRDLPREKAQQTAPSDDSQRPAPQSQVDFIKTLAEEWRGEKGVELLESRIGKPLDELTRDEATHWIDRLTPKNSAEAAE